MNIFIILLLALDLRMAHGFNQPEKSQAVEVVVVGSDKCPKDIQPVCATNGQQFLYFQNKCHMEVKNYEFLTQGLLEYFECPLIFCKTECPNCAFINEPLCAAELLTGETKLFDNSCEVERTMCITKRAWTVVDSEKCVMNLLSKILKPLNNILKDADCPVLCPLDYRPICARFMSLEKEFTNECELKATICRSQQVWHIIRQGPCHAPPNDNAVAHTSPPESKCLKTCPADYKPICAKFNDKLREFGNRCELDNIICQFGHNWQVLKEGHCFEDQRRSQHRECPEFCLNEHEPVCARFGAERKEFRNLCELLKEKCVTSTNWEILNLGPCITNPQKIIQPAIKCSQTCAKYYKPVCAKFERKLKEFRNQCELEKTICESKTDWKVFKQGTCPLTTSTCRKSCTREFQPVCASYNGQHREFFNSCELEKISCETNTAWQLMKSGPCSVLSPKSSSSAMTCPHSCPNDYQTVCAEFNSKLKEFDNKCEMEKSICETNINWRLLKTGRCPLITENKGPCARICAKEFSPVCARLNGKLREFFNDCELEKIACETNTNWEILNRGPCFVNQFKRFVENSCENEILEPVCAIYDHQTKTFDNVCQLAIEIERSGNIWYILHRGACSDMTSSPTNNLEKIKIENSALKVITVTNEGNKYSIRKHMEKGKSINEDYHSSESTGLNDELDEKETEPLFGNSEEHYGNDDPDYDLSSEDENNFSSYDDETYRHWAEAQNNTLNSKENHADGENNFQSMPISAKSLSQDPIKPKNPTFNYEGYSQEDNASEESYCEKTHKDCTSVAQSAKTNSTKPSEPCSELEEETENQNHTQESTNRDSEKEDKYADAESKAENASLYETDTRTKNNFPENYLQEKNLKKSLSNDIPQNQVNLTLSNSQTSEKSYSQNQPKSNYENDATLPLATENVQPGVKETNSKKGEIYNGVVYKAPVYDAPTYNFIYTAPFKYPGFDLHAVDHNQTTKTETAAKVPFHPFHFFSSLAGNLNSISLSQTTNAASKQNLNYGEHTEPNENQLNFSKASPPLIASSTSGNLSNTALPVSGLPSSKPNYLAPSLTPEFAPALHKAIAKQNSTLLNEVIKTLKSLTNQV